jgi:hypothetical protein
MSFTNISGVLEARLEVSPELRMFVVSRGDDRVDYHHFCFVEAKKSRLSLVADVNIVPALAETATIVANCAAP